MPLPTARILRLPLLKYAVKAGEFHTREAYDPLRNQLNISPSEDVTYPGKSLFIFNDRVNWARSRLLITGYFSKPRPGYNCITPKGLEAAANFQNIESFANIVSAEYERIRTKTLVESGQEKIAALAHLPETEDQSPRDLIEAGYQQYRQTLKLSLLERIAQNSPAFFEDLVVKLLVGMGYGGSIDDAAQVVGRSGDGGIDGTIKQDPLGLDIVYIQAKRYQGKVGGPEMLNFLGALNTNRASKGVFITTSDFNPGARQHIEKSPYKVILINGNELTNLLVRYRVGLNLVREYPILSLDEDFFSESTAE